VSGPIVAINPESLGAPRGYSNGMLVPAGARILFVAGQVGWGAGQRIVEGGFVAQFEQALRNVVAVATEAGGAPESVVRMTIFVTDVDAYRAGVKAIGVAYRRIMGRHFPAMTLVRVVELLEPGAVVEIEATAAIA